MRWRRLRHLVRRRTTSANTSSVDQVIGHHVTHDRHDLGIAVYQQVSAPSPRAAFTEYPKICSQLFPESGLAHDRLRFTNSISSSSVSIVRDKPGSIFLTPYSSGRTAFRWRDWPTRQVRVRALEIAT
jgi:hypothetical protein